MVRHPHVQAWELRLRQVFERIDEELEREYGTLYPLHPARPPHGATASREDDGLFDVGAAFSAGFGSAHGAGYVVEVRMVTLSRVPAGVRERIEASVVDRLRAALPRAFPDRDLRVERDGPRFKIIGDLGVRPV